MLSQTGITQFVPWEMSLYRKLAKQAGQSLGAALVLYSFGFFIHNFLNANGAETNNPLKCRGNNNPSMGCCLVPVPWEQFGLSQPVLAL